MADPNTLQIQVTGSDGVTRELTVDLAPAITTLIDKAKPATEARAVRAAIGVIERKVEAGEATSVEHVVDILRQIAALHEADDPYRATD